MRDVRRHHNPRELTVVTSDRVIQKVAQQHGVWVIDLVTFAAEISRPPETGDQHDDQPLSEEEVQAWLTIFGQSDER
jgi:hypothetical protein